MENPEGLNLLPGMTASAKIKMQRTSDATILLPSSSLTPTPDNKLAVWVFDPESQIVSRRVIESGAPTQARCSGDQWPSGRRSNCGGWWQPTAGRHAGATPAMMNLAQFVVNRPIYGWILALACLFGGIHGIENVGRLEDPDFPIKWAYIITTYPGASAEEVEQR